MKIEILFTFCWQLPVSRHFVSIMHTFYLWFCAFILFLSFSLSRSLGLLFIHFYIWYRHHIGCRKFNAIAKSNNNKTIRWVMHLFNWYSKRWLSAFNRFAFDIWLYFIQCLFCLFHFLSFWHVLILRYKSQFQQLFWRMTN